MSPSVAPTECGASLGPTVHPFFHLQCSHTRFCSASVLVPVSHVVCVGEKDPSRSAVTGFGGFFFCAASLCFFVSRIEGHRLWTLLIRYFSTLYLFPKRRSGGAGQPGSALLYLNMSVCSLGSRYRMYFGQLSVWIAKLLRKEGLQSEATAVT